MIIANVRILGASLTGVKRYAREILRHLGERIEEIAPKGSARGVRGHLWEQFVLPARVGRRLLWSPGATGPLAVARQVVTIHDLAPLDHPQWLNPRFAGWYRWLVPKLVRRVRHVIAVSQFTKRRIVETTGAAPEKITVIHNGVDLRFEPKTLDEIRQVRRTLGIPSQRYVLSLGSLEPRKNLHRLLEAWNMVGNNLPGDVWLVIAGAKGKSRIFRSVSFEELPARVLWIGSVKDKYLPALYSGAATFVYPSMNEGFGLPPLEAMACGVPPITADRTALPEVVGDAGIMVDPYDPAAIASAIRQIVTDRTLREELAKRALSRARKFSWQRAAEQTWQVLQAADKG